LKPCIENCGQTAAHILIAYRNSSSHCPTAPSPTPYDLPFSQNSLPHDWHSRVRNDPSRSSKVSDFHVMSKRLTTC